MKPKTADRNPSWIKLMQYNTFVLAGPEKA